MYLGEVVETAPTEALFSSPRHPYTQALLSAIPSPQVGAHAERTRLQGDPPNPAAPPPGCRFHTRCPHAGPRCAEARPALEDLGGGRSVACHRHAEIAPVGRKDPAPARSNGALRRFALYRALRAQEEAVSAASLQSQADTEEIRHGR